MTSLATAQATAIDSKGERVLCVDTVTHLTLLLTKPGDYESGIETLVGAISLIKQSPTAVEERCQVRRFESTESKYPLYSADYLGMILNCW